MLFKGKTKEFQDELVQWRRNFHQHPELSFEEFEKIAAKRVADLVLAIAAVL